MTLREELPRKGFHLLALIIPLLYLTVDHSLMLALLVAGTVLAWMIEWARHRRPGFNAGFTRIFRVLLRTQEKDHGRVTGATYLMTGALGTMLLCDVWFGSKEIAVAALLFLILGDTIAAVVGQWAGRTRLCGKTLEGTLAFLLTGACLVWWTGLVDWRVGMTGALSAAVTELIPLPLDDNLLIPLVSGAVMAAISLLLGMLP